MIWQANDAYLCKEELPRWLENPLPFIDQGPHSPLVMTITLGVAMISSGMIAPIIEELYFRGFLLPRIDGLGVWAVLLNVSLFAFHHLWTPLSAEVGHIDWQACPRGKNWRGCEHASILVRAVGLVPI